MELKVGMYVRTKHYGIFKILKIIKEKDKLWFLRKPGHQVLISDKYNPIEEEIIGEPIFNPIDLIEVGDYVNGYKVYESDDVKWIIDWQSRQVDIRYLKIKSIVTKEQFKSVSYKVGE